MTTRNEDHRHANAVPQRLPEGQGNCDHHSDRNDDPDEPEQDNTHDSDARFSIQDQSRIVSLILALAQLLGMRKLFYRCWVGLCGSHDCNLPDQAETFWMGPTSS